LDAEKEIPAVRHKQAREGKQRINNVQPRWFFFSLRSFGFDFITYI
jgi:hypothetical protein